MEKKEAWTELHLQNFFLRVQKLAKHNFSSRNEMEINSSHFWNVTLIFTKFESFILDFLEKCKEILPKSNQQFSYIRWRKQKVLEEIWNLEWDLVKILSPFVFELASLNLKKFFLFYLFEKFSIYILLVKEETGSIWVFGPMIRAMYNYN